MLSLFTSGVVDGSESLSFPASDVIVSPVIPSTSSLIHATFVNTLSTFCAFIVTSHSISIVSELKLPSEYADKLFVFPVFLESINLLSPVSSYDCTSKFPLTILENFNPVGSWSTIFVALPSFSPSL